MKQLPTAQEFLEYRTPRGIDNVYPDYWEAMIDFAKLHVKAALEAAADNAEVQFNGDEFRYTFLHCYPESNIK